MKQREAKQKGGDPGGGSRTRHPPSSQGVQCFGKKNKGGRLEKCQNKEVYLGKKSVLASLPTIRISCLLLSAPICSHTPALADAVAGGSISGDFSRGVQTRPPNREPFPEENHGPQPRVEVLSCVNDAVLSSGSNAASNGCHYCVCSCRSVGNYTWIQSNYLETCTLV